jgi:hypothetical protein
MNDLVKRMPFGGPLARPATGALVAGGLLDCLQAGIEGYNQRALLRERIDGQVRLLDARHDDARLLAHHLAQETDPACRRILAQGLVDAVLRPVE